MKLKDSIIMILVAVLAIGIGVFIGSQITDNWDSSLPNNNVQNESSSKDNVQNETESKNKVDISGAEKYLHSVELEQGSRLSSLGEIVITNLGNVYYVPSDEVLYDGGWEEVTIIDDQNIGLRKKYKINGYNESDDGNGNLVPTEFNGYKLNITNVQSAYNIYFGTGGESKSVIIVGKDGKISEFGVYKAVNGFKMVLEHNIDGYNNIVSVVPQHSFGGNSALLIDKNGKYYNYFGFNYFG